MKQQNRPNSVDILEKLLLYLKLNANKLANELGLNSNVSIYHIRNGRHNISANLAEKIVSRFPEINYEWLLTGRGPMLKDGVVIMKNADHNENRRKAEFEEILDRLSVDEIITYIHKYEKEREFDQNETYKMFLEIRNQRRLLDYLENELEKNKQ